MTDAAGTIAALAKAAQDTRERLILEHGERNAQILFEMVFILHSAQSMRLLMTHAPTAIRQAHEQMLDGMLNSATQCYARALSDEGKVNASEESASAEASRVIDLLQAEYLKFSTTIHKFAKNMGKEPAKLIIPPFTRH
jgi:hypothetical protein